MKRIFLAIVGLALALTLVYGFSVTRQEREYRRLVIQGDYALARADTFQAVRVFGDAIARKPDSMLGYLKRGDAHRRRGDLEAATEDLERATELDPASPQALELLGDVEAARQLHERAAEHYAASVRLDDRPRVLYKLGLSLHVTARDQQASEALTQALALDSRFAEAHYLLGVCLRGLGRPREAEPSLRRALALAPGLTAAREQLADVYGVLGRRVDRIAELERLLTADPTPGRHVALAAAYLGSGQTRRALRQLEKAAELFPDDAVTQLALGRVWLDMAEAEDDPLALSKSIEALHHAAAHDSSGAAAALLGKAYLSMRDPEGARDILQSASERLPALPETFLYLADAAERAGDALEARRALLDYRSLAGPRDAHSPVVSERIADLSMSVGEANVAIRFYEEAAADPRATAPLMAKLAEAQLATGDRAGARATLLRLLEKNPDSPLAAPIERRLR